MQANGKNVPVRQVKAIDLPVRLFHWLTVLTFVLAYVLADSYRDAHQWLGYALAVLLGLRVVWGLIGSHYARFTTIIPSLLHLLRYLAQLLRRKEAYSTAYNPLGASMVVFMLLNLATIALSGHLLTTDRYWGDDAMSALHSLATQTMLALIALHLLGVLYTSMRQRQNLAKAMIDGYKRAS